MKLRFDKVMKTLLGIYMAVILTAFAACETNSFRDQPYTEKVFEDPRVAWEDWGRFEPEFVIIDMPQELTQVICQIAGSPAPPVGYHILACAELGPKKPGEACIIFMSGDLWHPIYLRVLEHEKAHCRGWKHGDPVPEGTIP